MKNLLILTLLLPLFGLAQIQQQSSFENPLPTGWQGATNKNYSPFGLIEGSEAWSFALNSSIYRSGLNSMKLDLHPGDRNVAYGSKRVEISGTTKATAVTYTPNVYRISTYIPSGVWSSSSQEEIFPMQFHPHKPGSTSGSPSLAIEIKNDRYRVMVRYTTSDYTAGGAEIFYPNGNGTDIGPVVRDKWIDWVVYYDPNISNPTQGRIIVWQKTITVDATPRNVFDYTGRCYHLTSLYPFWKFGIYKWNNPASGAASTYRTAYIDMAAFGKATPTTALALMQLNGPPPPAPNQAPVITSLTSNDNYIAGTTSAALNVVGNDPERGRLTYLWAKTSGPAVVLNNPTTASATATGLTNGNVYVFRVTLTDSVGATAIGTKSVTIATANNAPVANAGISRQLSLGQDSVHMDGEATDVEDGGACCTPHTWSLVSGPNTPTYTPTDWNPVVTNLIEGTYVFKLSITDSGGLSAESTVSYTVPHVNQIPTISPNPPVVRVRSASTADIGFTTNDPDGPHPTIVISQVSGPNTAGITASTSDTTGLTGLVIGTYIFKGIVTDNKGATAQATITVIVNNPPSVDLSGNTTVSYPSGTVSYNAVSTATDTDGSISSGVWSTIEKPVGSIDPTFTSASTDNTTINGLGDGVYIFRREVTDNDGVTGYADLTLTIYTTRMVVPKIRYRVL